MQTDFNCKLLIVKTRNNKLKIQNKKLKLQKEKNISRIQVLIRMNTELIMYWFVLPKAVVNLWSSARIFWQFPIFRSRIYDSQTVNTQIFVKVFRYGKSWRYRRLRNDLMNNLYINFIRTLKKLLHFIVFK